MGPTHSFDLDGFSNYRSLSYSSSTVLKKMFPTILHTKNTNKLQIKKEK